MPELIFKTDPVVKRAAHEVIIVVSRCGMALLFLMLRFQFADATKSHIADSQETIRQASAAIVARRASERQQSAIAMRAGAKIR